MSKAVRFIKKQTPYNEGEVAGFPEDLANRYIELGIAEVVSGDQLAEDASVQDAEYWKKKFNDLAAKTTTYYAEVSSSFAKMRVQNDDLRSRIADLNHDRDNLAARVAELEKELSEATSPKKK